MNKRILSLLLLTSLTAGLFACGSDTPSVSDTTEPAPSDTTEASPYDENGFLLDNLPDELDFGGQTVTIYVRGDTIDSEFNNEGDGDIVNDAVYERNLAVQERLGVNLEFFANTTDDYWGERELYINTVRQSVLTNDGSIDLVGGLSILMPLMMQEGLFFDLLDADMPYLDFTQPWWPALMIDEMSVNGRLYFASGEASLGVIKGMMCYYFNKDMIADLQLEDPYALVDSGKWTLDKFYEMASGAYHDVNGNTTVDEGDRMSFVMQNVNHGTNFFTASGLYIIKPDDTGKPALQLDSERVVDMFNKVIPMLKEDGFVIKTDGSSKYENTFRDNLALFATGEFGYAELYRDLGFDFGIIPFPKYDEAQENYMTCARSTFTGFAIPATANKEAAAAVLECFASESYRRVTPAFYESALKVKYSRDDISARMFDAIKDSVCYDFGIIFNQVLDGVSNKIRAQIIYRQDTWASEYAALEKSVNEKLKAYLDTIDKLEN